MSTDKAFASFRIEARHLRDSAIAALTGSHIGRVEDALDIYRELLRKVLETDREMHRVHDRAFGGDSLTEGREYGREWRTLLRDLYAIVDVLAEDPSTRSWSDFCSFLGDVSADAAKYAEGQAIRDYWLLGGDAWGAVIRLDSAIAPRLRDNLLFTLHNLAWIRRPSGLGPRDNAQIVRRLAAAYVSLMKQAVDSDSEVAVLECLEYFDNSFDPQFSDWASADEITGKASEEHTFVTACLLAVYAWVLYRVGERGRPDMPKVRARIAESLRKRPLWAAMKALRRDDLDGYLGTTWWEIEMKGGRGGGVMILSTYESLAAVLAGVRPPAPQRALESDFEEARVLTRLLDEGESGVFNRVRAMLQTDTAETGGLVQLLANLVEKSENEAAELLASAALVPSRVQLFRDAVLTEVAESRLKGPVSFFALSEDAAPLEAVLGWQGRVPKHYFTDSDVHADGQDLGRSFANSLATAEEGRLLEELAGNGDTHAVDIENLLRIAEGLDSERWAVITNSWAATEALAPDWWRADEEKGPQIGTSGLPVYQVWTDREPFAVFMDRDQSVQVMRGSVDASEPTDVVDPNLGLLIGVSDLSESDLVRLENAEFPVPRLEARGTAMVKVLERFSVRVVSEPRIQWCALPPD